MRLTPFLLFPSLLLAAEPVAIAGGPGADIDLQSFHPAIDSRGFVTVNSPVALGSGEPSFGLVTTWGHGVLHFQRGDRSYDVDDMISPTLVGAAGLHLAGLPLEVAASVPFHVMAGDRGPDSDGGTPADPNDDEGFGFQGQGLGDVSLHLKAQLARQQRAGVAIGVIATVTAPTATADAAWIGDRGIRAQALFAIERRLGRWRVAINGGYRYRASGATRFVDEPTMDASTPAPAALPYTGGVIQVASTIPFGAAIGYDLRPGTVTLVAETFGAVPLASEHYQPLEVIAGAKLYLARSSYLTFGAGGGLLPGAGGKPKLRAFLGIVFEPRLGHRIGGRARVSPPASPRDLPRAGDVPVSEKPGDPDPDLDRDRDGILDVDDLCPDEPEDVDHFEDRDGCPDPDNDHDDIVDTDDGCPRVDGESRADTAEVYNGRDDDDGCPDGRIRMGDTVMAALEAIHFEFDSAIIKPESFSILNEIASTLDHNPQLLRIEVQGHTDERGDDAYNLDLSQRRAESVVRYLVGRGVAARRLEARGYGETVPRNPEHTPEAWKENRRVELHIVETGGDRTRD